MFTCGTVESHTIAPHMRPSFPVALIFNVELPAGQLTVSAHMAPDVRFMSNVAIVVPPTSTVYPGEVPLALYSTIARSNVVPLAKDSALVLPALCVMASPPRTDATAPVEPHPAP